MAAARASKLKLQSIDTKQKLYDNAVYLISKEGYNNVTVDEICERSKVTKGAFYAHFSSKAEIVVMMNRKTDEWHQVFFDSMAASCSSKHKLVSFLTLNGQKILEKGIDNQRVIYAAELDIDNRPEYITDLNRPLYKCLFAIIAEGQERGEFRADIDAKEIVHIIVMEIRGITLDWIITDGERDLLNMIDIFTKLLVDSITAKKE